jgi:hypothetical protein
VLGFGRVADRRPPSCPPDGTDCTGRPATRRCPLSEQDPLLGIQAGSTRLDRSAVATVAFSIEPSQSPSGILTPSVVVPGATKLVRALSSIPSIIIIARRTSSSGRLTSASRFSRVPATNSRETADLDVERASLATSLSTGSRVRRKRRVERRRRAAARAQPRERVAIGEMLVGAKRHLGLAVGRAHARTLNRDAAASERDLTGLVAMTHRDGGPDRACPSDPRRRSPPPPSVGNDTEPDAAAERQQPSFAAPTSSPSASCTRAGSTPPARSRPPRAIRVSP